MKKSLKPAVKPVKRAVAKKVVAKKVAAKKTTAKKAVSKTSNTKKPPPRPPVEPPQIDPVAAFEHAIRLLRAGEFREAKQRFDELADSSPSEVAHAARAHSRMCEQRLTKQVLHLVTADDHYHYGITLINSRRLEEARQEVETALRMAPNADHIHYALALCLGLKGDLPAAYTHLKRAIELQPKNRLLARNDPDFTEIGKRPPLSDLLARQA
jgi:tetratricopeptide (TPR) repeat protein